MKSAELARQARITVERAAWVLNGVISNERYVERQEKVALVSLQEGLGRFAGAELESALTVEIAVAEFLAEEPATRGSPS